MPAARAKPGRPKARSLDGRGRGDDCHQVRLGSLIGPDPSRAPHARLWDGTPADPDQGALELGV